MEKESKLQKPFLPRGVFPALVTPFTKEGELDEAALRRLVRFCLPHVDGFVPCGTTGENPSFLTWEEHFRVVEIVVREARGRLKVVAGAGTNSTTRSLENVRRAEDIGADGALLITPYYNKPSQIGLYNHFRKIAESCSIPLMIYNVPSRTAVDLHPETAARLAELKNIVALKEASGSVERVSTVVRLAGNAIDVLSGNDADTLPILAVGGRGVVSVAGNFIPAEMKAMITAFEEGDLETARRLHLEMLPLFQAMFIETNPVPVKELLSLAGLCQRDPRLPLVPCSEQSLTFLVQFYEGTLADLMAKDGAEGPQP